MKQTQNSPAKIEYQFSNTLYKVKSVYKDEPKTERLEDKIKRLILNDNGSKPPAA